MARRLRDMNRGSVGSTRRDGYTLVEVLIVALILGLFASVALPVLTTPDAPQKLDRAGMEIAEALRFARDESMRTGRVLGVLVDPSAERLTVFAPKLDTLPVVPEATLDHPLRRQPWDLLLTTNRWTRGVEITNAAGPFDYVGLAAQSEVYFDASGQPFGLDVATGTRHRPIFSTTIALRHGDATSQIEIHPIHGRVRVN